MKKMTNPFERFYILASILKRREANRTLSQISKLMQVPLHVLHEDLWAVMNSARFQNWISMLPVEALLYEKETESFSDHEVFFSELDENQKKEIRDALFDGKYDDNRTFVLTDESDQFSYCPVNQEERLALHNYYPELLEKRHQMKYYTKKSHLSLSKEQKLFLNLINMAIGDQHGIQVELKNSSLLELIPVKIFFDREEEMVYCLGSNGKRFLLHEVSKIKILQNISKTEVDLPEIEYVWGADYEKDEEIVHVKIWINYMIPNLISKIEADVAGRKYGKLTKNEDGTYLYEDDILGIEAFKRWVKSYGASMVVLEPKSLAREIYESAKEGVKIYRAKEFSIVE